MSEFTINGAVLKVLNGVKATLPREISEAIGFKNVVVVRLAATKESSGTENVFGVDASTGQTLWQIPPLNPNGTGSSYVEIKKLGGDDHVVVLYDWDGMRVRVEADTGRVIKRTWGK